MVKGGENNTAEGTLLEVRTNRMDVLKLNDHVFIYLVVGDLNMHSGSTASEALMLYWLRMVWHGADGIII